MRKLRWLFAVVMVLAMLCEMAPLAAAPSPSDVADDHWAAVRIRKLVSDNVIKGFDDGTFRPDETLTREQFAALIVRAQKLELVNPQTPTFKDVSKDRWSYKEIETVAKYGYMKGYGANTFGPEDTIKRCDIALTLIRIMGLESQAAAIAEPCLIANDEAQVPNYAVGAMTLAYRAGIQLLTYRWGRLSAPLEPANRAEAAYAVYGMKYPPSKGQIVFRRDMDPTGFCALFTQLGGTATAYGYMVEPFVGVAFKEDGTATFYPRMIEEIPSIENGLWKMLDGGRMEVTYPLRKTLRWSDGEPVTAYDAQFALKVFMNKDVPIINRQPYEKIEKLEVIDEHTFKITWKEPYPHAWLINHSVQGYAGILSLPKHVFESAYNKAQKDGDWKSFQDNVASNPVLAGPYKLKEYRPGEEVVFEPNPYYYMGKPNASTLIMKIVPDESTFTAMILNGQIDYGGIDLASALKLEQTNSKDLNLVYYPSQNSVIYIGGNYNDPKDLSKKHPVLGDSKVRQAILYAIDRDEINEVVYSGKHLVCDTWLGSPRHPLYSADSPVHYEFNPAKAKAILDELGWKVGSDGIRVKNGVRMSIENVTPTGDQAYEQMQMMIREYLKDVGIEFKPNNMPWNVFSANFRKYRKFDTMLASWGWGVFSEGDTYFHSSTVPSESNGWSGLNYYGYSNSDNDALLTTASVTMSPSDRKALYEEHLKIFSEDLPIMPIFALQNASFYRNGVEDYNLPGSDPGATESAFRWYKTR